MAAVLGVGLWALQPPVEPAGAGIDVTGSAAPKAEHARGGGAQRDPTGSTGREVEYVLRFCPGYSYVPGTVPFGIGKPLEGLTQVLREFEARFPDTRVEITPSIIVREYLVTQLSSGRAPDIVNVNVEDVWTDIQKGWYVPLDAYLEAPNPFIVEKGDPSLPGARHWWDMFRYQAISRGKAAPDGLNYCLSFDMIETGIFYNKTLFDKLGLAPPHDWPDFVRIMEKIRSEGLTPIAIYIDCLHDWATDLFFDQLYYNLLPGIDLFQDPIREPYLEGYLDWDEICFLYRQGFFTPRDPRYVEMWRLIYEFRQYCSRDMSNMDFIREFVTQRAAMMWQSSAATFRMVADKDLGFEWGVFYLPQFTRETTRYASDTPMCVIGGSGNQFEVTSTACGDTGDPATSKRLQRVIALLQFITVPENYVRVVNEYPCMLPNIVGVPVLPDLKPFEEILERRYTTTKWIFTFDLKFAEIQRRMLELYLNDGATLDEFLEWQNRNLESATNNLLQRKNIDLDRLRKTWDELAPVRATMEDLPGA